MDAVEAEAGNSLVTNDNDAIPGSVVWTAYVRDANGNIKPAAPAPSTRVTRRNQTSPDS